MDTLFWIALINPRDQWHAAAAKLDADLRGSNFVTTEAVLIEVMNYFSSYGAEGRQKTARVVQAILNRDDVEVVEQTHDAFLAGTALYESRLDKGYSLTDCISMNVMRERGLSEVLTHDNHFTQEGFITLL